MIEYFLEEDLSNKLRTELHDAVYEHFCHHGPYVAQLDYIDAGKKPVKGDQRCKAADIDP